MKTYDVLVVGGRVAGASTALHLARAGLSVALLDRARRGTDTLSTHALMRAGVLQLSRAGVLDTLVAHGTTAIRRARFHHPDGEVADVRIAARAGMDALYAPRRHLLDRVLVDAAEEAGAHVLHEAAVTALRRDVAGRVVGVSARTSRGSSVELGAGLTVGADGIRSRVAEQAGAAVRWQGRTASAVLYRYVEGGPTDAFEWAYGDGVGAGAIATNDGQACVFVGTTPTRMRGLRRQSVDQAFDHLTARAGPAFGEVLRDARPASRIHGWSGAPGFVRDAWGPGWALVGDAGAYKDPITSHGITDALRDAELLADAVVASRGDRAAETTALAGYEATRDRLSHRLFAATERVAAYDWDADGIRSLLREVSSAMSDEVDHLAALPSRTRTSVPAP